MSGLLRGRLADAAALLGLGLFAFWCTFAAGQRGFFPYDQSIVFDGGYRIFSGQVPYKDFLLCTGPIAYVLQALFFHWLGVNYTTYLTSTAVFNVMAAFLGVAVTRMVFPPHRWLSYGAGVLTAIWFYPPFGTFAAEQTAFFFSLAALWLALGAICWGRDRRLAGPTLALGSGAMTVLAILSKQHAGLYLLPLPPLVFLVADAKVRRRAAIHCGSFALGLALSLLVFWGWLWAASDVHRFVQYAFEVPAQFGWERIFRKGTLGLLKALLIGVGPRTIRPVVVAMELLSFLAVGTLLRRADSKGGARFGLIACVICASLTHFQHLLTYTMDNESINGLPFLGVIVAMGLGLLGRAWPRLWSTVKIAVILLSFGVPAAVGVRVAFVRQAHATVAGSVFPRPIDVPTWRPLRWGQPTVLHGAEIREADVVQLYRELKARHSNFFIFPDFTIFYGLTGRPSPQPVLVFNKGLTYPSQYDPALDAWIVRSLEAHHVEVVVIEEVSWRNTGDSRQTLSEFPQLETYLRDTFRASHRIGIFTIYEKRMR